ncbi:hypothetical protein J53TS2_34930 [Paenibacillus sp. J53TS2]|nr:hypothetical protein J53TS2_34930 [Paenibacillus sp. J53TS2]
MCPPCELRVNIKKDFPRGKPYLQIQMHFSISIRDDYKTIAQGTSTQTWAATSQEWKGFGGLFLEDNHIAATVPADSQSRFGVRPWAIDKEQAKRLWKLSEEMTGVHFDLS